MVDWKYSGFSVNLDHRAHLPGRRPTEVPGIRSSITVELSAGGDGSNSFIMHHRKLAEVFPGSQRSSEGGESWCRVYMYTYDLSWIRLQSSLRSPKNRPATAEALELECGRMSRNDGRTNLLRGGGAGGGGRHGWRRRGRWRVGGMASDQASRASMHAGCCDVDTLVIMSHHLSHENSSINLKLAPYCLRDLCRRPAALGNRNYATRSNLHCY